MHRHTMLLFLILLMLLIILCGGINPKDTSQLKDSVMSWGKFQLLDNAQSNRLSNKISSKNQPSYYNEYKWLVKK